MVRKKVYNLGGKMFSMSNTLCCPNIHRHRTLWDVYKKPSAAKVAIYNDWRNWLTCCSENGNDFITIESFNVHRFTLSGVVTINTINYVIYITPTKNCCMKVSREYCREVLGWKN